MPKPISRLVLHIGMPKTGTSSIQQSLAGVETPDGFRYARIFGPNHTGVLEVTLAPEKSIARKAAKWGRGPEEMCARRDAAMAALHHALSRPGRTAVISGEGMSSFGTEGMAKVIDFCGEYADQIDVVGFVRSPLNGMTSSFQQRIKGGYARDMLPLVNYRLAFEPAMKLLGQDRVKAVLFEPGLFIEGSLVRTFLSAIGEPNVPFNEVRANESMPADAVRLIYHLNRTAPGRASGRANVLAHRILQRLFTATMPEKKLSIPKGGHWKGRMAEQVNWLRAHTDIDFNDDLEAMETSSDRARSILQEVMSDLSPEAVGTLEELAAERGLALGANWPETLDSLWNWARVLSEEATADAASKAVVRQRRLQAKFQHSAAPSR